MQQFTHPKFFRVKLLDVKFFRVKLLDVKGFLFIVLGVDAVFLSVS